MTKIILFCLNILNISLLTVNVTQAEQKYNNFISPSSKSYFIQHDSKEIFQVKVLTSPEELAKGFSGVKSEQVSAHQGLFFKFKQPEKRFFWMPDTYFNLMIIYLNEQLKVVDIVRDAPHHVGYSEKDSPIYRAPPIIAMHVLEIKSSSPTAQKIKKGSQFRWIKAPPNDFPQK